MNASAEVHQGINPSEVRLSTIEADKQAFALMVKFRTKLFSMDAFKNAATDAYLNIAGDQNKNVGGRRTEVEININNSTYRVDYSFTGNEQRLFMMRKTLGEPVFADSDDPELIKTTDIIILKSRRFVDQKPIRSPEVRWYRLLENMISRLEMTVPNPQSNTAFAVDQANKMLSGLSPQAHQK